MGVFTSACRNCNEPIHWFVQFDDTNCTKCGAHNNKDDLYGNRIDSAVAYNMNRNRILDRRLYEKEIDDYVSGKTENE